MNQLRIYNRYLFHNRVKTSGRNLRLGKGGLGLVLFGSSNKDGMKVLAPEDIKNLSKEDKLAFQVGQTDKKNMPNGAVDTKNLSTFKFRLKDIVGVDAISPLTKETEDEFLVGYNGVDEDSALYIPEGETRSFEIQLENGLLSMYAGNKDRHIISFDMHREEGQTMQEVVTEAIEDLKNRGFGYNDNYDKLVDISLIDSTSVAGEKAYVTYELDLSKVGEYQVPFAVGMNPNLLGFVQSQYDDFDVKDLGEGKYGVMLEDEGNGAEKPEDFEMPSVLTVTDNCDNCAELEGYEPSTEGYIYSVIMADLGEDESATIKAQFELDEGVTSATAEKLDNKENKGVYAVVTDGVLDVTELAELEGAEVLLVGHTNEICIAEESETYEWVITDETCTAKTETYTIVLPDTECGEDRLEDLKAAYDNENIVLGAAGGCNHGYTMEVATNVVCEECDDIYLDIFTTEKPVPFEGVKWKKETAAGNEEALMGFRVKAKRIKNIPPSYLQDMGNTNTAVDISISAGICIEGDVLDDTCPEDKDIEVMKVATNQIPSNMGYQLKFFESRDSNFLGGKKPHANLHEQYLTGSESLIEPDKQYIIHSITVLDREYHDEANKISYKFPSKIGYQGEIEALLNALAAKLELEPIKTL